jgi:hypothetical protein
LALLVLPPWAHGVPRQFDLGAVRRRVFEPNALPIFISAEDGYCAIPVRGEVLRQVRLPDRQNRAQMIKILPNVQAVWLSCSIATATLSLPFVGLANHYFAVQHSSCEKAGSVSVPRSQPFDVPWDLQNAAL